MLIIRRLMVCWAIIIGGIFVFPVFAQEPPASQTAGGILKQEKQMEKIREIEKEIKTKEKEPEKAEDEEVLPGEEGEKVLIKEIRVEGASLISDEDIEKVVSGYEGKELSMGRMQKAADLITDEYRKKGYTTSRAYIPPQTIQKGILIIRVIEGELGKINIEGNTYFKSSLLRNSLRLKAGEPFDYSKLQNSLTYINEHPDRTARVVLVPGEKQGTTDIVLKVEDNLPIHLGFNFDNYGSRYIEKDRYSVVFDHNNLFGFDDKLHIEFQRAEYELYRMRSFRYVVPINITTEIGGYASRSHTKLGREFQPVDSRGSTKQYGIFLTKDIITKPDLDITLNLGFDYKDISNYLLGILNSRDELRIVKAGLDFDISDKLGRTIFTTELNVGIPDIMGGSEDKDPQASRAGAGGEFYKGVFNLFRLQPGPFSSYFLWKNQAQFSAYTLAASEQFQIGGPVSVRGYPPAEESGDKGYYTSFEWSFPSYVFPKDWKVPFTNDSLYDALHTVLFYDWAAAHLNNPAGGKKHQTLKGAGFGFRLNLSNDFSARIEFGYPLGKDSSDGHNMQHWVEVTHLF